MPALVAVTGAMCSGGAVFVAGAGASAALLAAGSIPLVTGLNCILVGDVSYCPEIEEETVVTAAGASTSLFIGGIPVALIGTTCTCGHSLVFSPNLFLSA